MPEFDHKERVNHPDYKQLSIVFIIYIQVVLFPYNIKSHDRRVSSTIAYIVFNKKTCKQSASTNY